MNYQLHLFNLISRARMRDLPEGYVEKHHIVPKCMGGDTTPENTVILTPEEHYVAHQLLIKIFPKERKLVFAAFGMSGGSERQSRTNKLYGWLRRKHAEALSVEMTGRSFSDETLAKMSAAKQGKKRSPHKPSTIEKMRAKALARPSFTQEHKDNMSKSQQARGSTRPPHDEQWRTNQSIGVQEAFNEGRVDQSFLQDPDYIKGQAEKSQAYWDSRTAEQRAQHSEAIKIGQARYLTGKNSATTTTSPTTCSEESAVIFGKF